MPKTKLSVLQRCGDYFYDYSAAIISVVDVITDVLVTIEFWYFGRDVFFGVAVSIFILAQFCYASLFTMAYGETLEKDKLRALCFMCIFPIAQIVPVFMWLDSYDLPCIKKILKYFNLSPNIINIDRECPEEKDALQFWLENKFLSHGGFMIEAAIEAFPQSILQMIAIVMYQEATPLNVFSIIVSMTSVASKMLMFSYSIDRVTFLFNFACMCCDIFGIFCTLSWVFYHPETNNENNDGLNSWNSFTFAGQIWIIKIMALVACCVIVLLFAGFIALFMKCTESFCMRNKPKYLQCCPCCKFKRHTHLHRGVANPQMNTQSACDNCKSNCVFTCFMCRACWKEICCICDKEHIQRRIIQKERKVRNAERSNRGRNKKRNKCKEEWGTWKKCSGKVGDIVIGILALIAVIAIIGLIPVAAVFLLGIAIMILEIVKLVFIPAVFYNMESDKHRSRVKFYGPIFHYLLKTGSKSDYTIRLAIINYQCIWEWARNNSNIKSDIDTMLTDKLIQTKYIDGLKILAEHQNWVKALMIPNTFKNQENTKQLTDLQQKRQERQNAKWKDIQENGNQKSEEVELRVNVQVQGTSPNNSNGNGGEEESKYPENDGDEKNNDSNDQNTQDMHKMIQERSRIPDRDDDKINALEGEIMKFNERKTKLSDESITKYVADSPFDISHLVDFKPKHYRKYTDTGFIFMFRFVFREAIQEVIKEIKENSDYAHINVCGKIMIVHGLVFLALGIYVITPIIVFLLLFSLFYPIIALSITYFVSGWHSVHYLQLSLTGIYVFVLGSIFAMIPRVYKFQHSNYHFYASRWGVVPYHAVSPSITISASLRYIQLFATKARNEIIKDFFQEMYKVMMPFLTPTHDIALPIENGKCDQKKLDKLHRQVTVAVPKVEKKLVDYMVF